MSQLNTTESPKLGRRPNTHNLEFLDVPLPKDGLVGKASAVHPNIRVPYVRQTSFHLKAKTVQQEQEYDLVAARNLPKLSGLAGSVANLVKGALGAGLLSGHVAFMKGGVWLSLFTSLVIGIFMTYCSYVLIKSAQTLCRRTRVPSMTYPDVGEAAMACTEHPLLMKLAKPFRYSIDAIICLDMFGACACYQLIIAKSIKQLVENQLETHTDPMIPGYPNLKVYVAIVIIPCVLISLLRHLQWLAPMSIVADGIIGLCIILTVYYAATNNPSFEHLNGAHTASGFMQFLGISMFSMSCSGVIIPVENNMKDPTKFTKALIIGMSLIMLAFICISFFGYMAYLEKCESPITLNFPMETLPKIVKGCIILMIYATHALNFWVPFRLVFHYLQPLHQEDKRIKWEMIYRVAFVLAIGICAIIFPSIGSLMGFIGAVCLPYMAFIWPIFIQLLVDYRHLGFGRYKWRLWRAVILIGIGICAFLIGTYVNAVAMYHVAKGDVHTAVKQALRNGEEFAFKYIFKHSKALHHNNLTSLANKSVTRVFE